MMYPPVAIRELVAIPGRNAIADDTPIAPVGATVEDGYRNAVISDPILHSAREGHRIEIAY